MDFHYKKGVGLPLSKALSLEWLETNGLGSYSSSTILNCHTRKYHGFLVTPNGKDKFVLLSKIDDFLVVARKGGEVIQLPMTSHQYVDAWLDSGYVNLRKIFCETNPQFVYDFGDIVIRKELLMPHGEDTILVKYKLLRNDKNAKIKLLLRPLFAYRSFHALTEENNALNTDVEKVDGAYVLRPYSGLPQGFMRVTDGFSFNPARSWYKNFSYTKEIERGFSGVEDLFAVGDFQVSMRDEEEAIFAYSLQNDEHTLVYKWRSEIVRRMNAGAKLVGTELQKHLQKIARSFMLNRSNKTGSSELSLEAGYHWYSEWGRDTMISLPGICLNSGLKKEFVSILQHFAQFEKDGLLPNILSDDPAYNSVDTSLWFSWAVQQYYLKTRDLTTIRSYFWPTLKNIFKHYMQGTHYAIKVQENLLLYAGGEDARLNLTWMDVEGITPRSGAPVEVNALWYNLLCFLRVLALQFNDPIEKELAFLIPKTRKSFREHFWDESLGFLKDFVTYSGEETKMSCALRPNQIFAVSLPYSPLTQPMAVSVMHAVETELLTPFGLRTLSRKHEDYIGSYTGDVGWRERAYHNGTVWPWLLGHFAEAMLKVADKVKVANVVNPCVYALEQHLEDSGGIGTISEIFCGDAPHKACGCISQAWSVAELLRLTYLL